MSLRSALRVSLLIGTLGPLSCAAETQDFPNLDDEGDGGTLTVSGSGGSPPVGTAGTVTMPMGGSNAFGGTASTAGTSSKGGTTSEGGKPGQGGSGQNGGSAGKGGSGSAGSSSAGASMGGSGTTGCTALRTWMPGTSMMIKPAEVIQWMGKRYKATQSIDWTNAECAPDKPADWCKAWFMADGSC